MTRTAVAVPQQGSWWPAAARPRRHGGRPSRDAGAADSRPACRRSRRSRTPAQPDDANATAPRVFGRSPPRRTPTPPSPTSGNRGRLIVGLDIGSNLFSFRDPITGEITGFDVDIAGEVARDIFGHAVAGGVPHPVVGRPHRGAAEQPGRHRRQDHEHHLRTQEAGRRSPPTICRPTSASWRRATRRSAGFRPSWKTGVRGERHDVDRSTAADQPRADHRRGGDVGRLPGRASAASGRRGQHRRLDPRGAGEPGSVPAHHRAVESPGAVRNRDQPGEHRPGAIRQRDARPNPSRRHVEHVVPQVVDGARPRTVATSPRYAD